MVPLWMGPGTLSRVPLGAAGPEGPHQLNAHGALILAPAAQGADPGPFGIDDFLLHPEDDGPDRLAGIPTGDQAGGGATSGTGAAGIAAVRQLGSDVPDLAVLPVHPYFFRGLFCHVSSKKNYLTVKLVRIYGY